MTKKNLVRRSMSRLTGFLSLTAALFVFLIIAASPRSVAAQLPGPAGYTFCANENQFCAFSGTANVAYGANGVFTFKTLTNGTPCTNAVFGDPIFGTVKACFYQIIPPTPPSLQFGGHAFPVENSASVAVTVTRTGSSVGAVSAAYLFEGYGSATGGSSCTEGVDFINTGGTVSFANGDSAAKTINVTLCNDASYEGDESFYLYLSNPTAGAVLGSPYYAYVNILDDESSMWFSASLYYGSEASPSVAVTVTRGGSVGAVSATYSLTDGSATGGASCAAGVDYVNTGGTVSFADGDSAAKAINVTLCNDAAAEAIEAFNVTLSNPTGNLTLGAPSTASVVVRDPGAATFTVNAIGDAGDGVCDATCTLRDAVEAANGDTQSDDTIIFEAGVFSAPQTIILTNWLSITDEVTINGLGADLVSISGNNASGVFGIGAGVTATLDAMTVRDGSYYYSSGGISNSGTLTVRNSVVTGNIAYDSYGGGIYNGGTMTLINSTVSGNYGYAYDWGSFGGGIYNEGTMIVNNSTISGNSSDYGGGIFNHGTLKINNSTISGNTAYSAGGVYNYGGTLSINDSTISGNTAYSVGGISSDSPNETLRNTIVAGNTVDGSPSEIFGTIGTASNSLIGHAGSSGGIVNGVNGNIVGVNPLLGPLQNNGGPTMTHALRPASPAINAGNICVLTANGCGDENSALVTDQRGMPRNGAVDIGAFERQANDPSFSTPFDFDGDGKADVSVYRPGTGAWYVYGSQAGFMTAAWGNSTDKLAAADYDGDGKTDYAVFRDGLWLMYQSTAGASVVGWGQAGDVPVPADYDGDGKADLAIVRDGVWWIYQSTAGPIGIAWGNATDIPVPADYDGDGKTDCAVFRDGLWSIYQSTAGAGVVGWGQAGDVPVPADYDGDGKTDVAIVRNGVWWIYQSTAGPIGIAWGNSTDIPTPADYDGDGKSDVAIFRDGTWWIYQSTAGPTGISWGLGSDVPVIASVPTD